VSNKWIKRHLTMRGNKIGNLMFRLPPYSSRSRYARLPVALTGSTPPRTKRMHRSATPSLSQHWMDAGRHHRRCYHRKANRCYRWYGDGQAEAGCMLCATDRSWPVPGIEPSWYEQSITVKVRNQLDATKYAVLLPQHVSGTTMAFIRSIINK
jgi:hypothetical protein